MVIDVVEGTAMEALPFMENIVNNKPETFPSIEKEIEYMFRSVNNYFLIQENEPLY